MSGWFNLKEKSLTRLAFVSVSLEASKIGFNWEIVNVYNDLGFN